VVVCVRKKRKVDSRVGKSGLARPGAVGMIGQSACMPHIVHDVNKACWLLACPEGLLDIPAWERSCWGGGAMVTRWRVTSAVAHSAIHKSDGESPDGESPT
jgi:hypothetical protein